MGLRPRLATAGPFRRHGTLLLPAIPIMKKSSFLSLERRRTAPKKKSFLARAHSTKKKSLCSFLSSLVQDDATTIALPCRRFLQGATGRRHHCPASSPTPTCSPSRHRPHHGWAQVRRALRVKHATCQVCGVEDETAHHTPKAERLPCSMR
jgi:hypothetical protein